MLKIAPSLLAADFSKLAEEVKRVEDAGADLLHIDVMDGHFVPNLSMGPMIVESLRNKSKLPFDVHLMVEEPARFVKPYADAGADIISVHVECFCGLYRTIKSIKEYGKKAGIVLNPPTPISSIEYLLNDLDMILIMSVDPGFGGQSFIPNVLPKISEARKMINEHELKIDLSVDGGVNEKTAPLIVKAGANVLVMGSAIFREKDVKSVIQKYKGIS